MTNGKMRAITVPAVLVWTLASVWAAPAAAAEPSGDCKRVRADWHDVLNAVGGTSGTITNGGILNGSTETVYNPAFVFTLDPFVVSYVATTTIATNQGQLVTNNVYLYNFVTGLGTTLGTIDPAASTGIFAAATGVLYFNTQTFGVFPDQSYDSFVGGTVCLAHQ